MVQQSFDDMFQAEDFDEFERTCHVVIILNAVARLTGTILLATSARTCVQREPSL
jgi:hypothetical protein